MLFYEYIASIACYIFAQPNTTHISIIEIMFRNKPKNKNKTKNKAIQKLLQINLASHNVLDA